MVVESETSTEKNTEDTMSGPRSLDVYSGESFIGPMGDPERP